MRKAIGTRSLYFSRMGIMMLIFSVATGVTTVLVEIFTNFFDMGPIFWGVLSGLSTIASIYVILRGLRFPKELVFIDYIDNKLIFAGFKKQPEQEISLTEMKSIQLMPHPRPSSLDGSILIEDIYGKKYAQGIIKNLQEVVDIIIAEASQLGNDNITVTSIVDNRKKKKSKIQ
ncbi:MAG: hypothetical protein FWE13_03500 [Firmicutes bacterium]|nr:hypothetical protein [Bacillota bacterium]